MPQEQSCSGQNAVSGEVEPQKRLGFQFYANKLVRFVVQGVYAVKLDSGGSLIIENKDGHWICDCGKAEEECPHIYAAQLLRLTIRNLGQLSDGPLRCRYCGSPDVRGCGVRYGARGIAHRYFCNECKRKFSIKHIEMTNASKAPSELLFYLNEIGLNLLRLNDLLDRVNKSLAKG